MRDLSISDSRSDSSSPSAPVLDDLALGASASAAAAQNLWPQAFTGDSGFPFSSMMYTPTLTSQMTSQSSSSTSSTPLHTTSTNPFDFSATAAAAAHQQYLYQQAAYNPWAYSSYGFPYQGMYGGTATTGTTGTSDSMGIRDVTIPSSTRSSSVTPTASSIATLGWAMTSEGKKKRQPYKKDQISRLEYEYKVNPYLTNKRRGDLSVQLMLDEKQVKVWFQNRRMKDKKLKQRVSGPYPHGELMTPSFERLIN